MEVKTENGTVSKDPHVVLNKWKTDYSNLLNPQNSGQLNNTKGQFRSLYRFSDEGLNHTISPQEVIEAMRCLKNDKAYEIDELPLTSSSTNGFI